MRENKKKEKKKSHGSRLDGKCGVKSGTRGIDESKTDEETTRIRETWAVCVK